MNNARGFSLVSSLVAMAIVGIVVAAYSTMFQSQLRETEAVQERLAASDFQALLTRSWEDGTVCTNLLAGKQFNSTNATPGNLNPPSIPLNRISIPISANLNAPPLATAGAPISDMLRTLSVNGANAFEVVGIVGSTDGSNGIFSGTFQIHYDDSKLIRPLRSASTLVILKTSTSGSLETVVSCASLSSPCWQSTSQGLHTSCPKVGIGLITPESALQIAPGGYLQIQSIGAMPSSSDCSASQHAGRMTLVSLSATSHKLCWCPPSPGGYAWKCAGESYSWNVSGWGPCSVLCGGGSQTRTVACEDSSHAAVSNSFCPAPAPPTSQVCNTQACTPTWHYGAVAVGTMWGPSSGPAFGSCILWFGSEPATGSPCPGKEGLYCRDLTVGGYHSCY